MTFVFLKFHSFPGPCQGRVRRGHRVQAGLPQEGGEPGLHRHAGRGQPVPEAEDRLHPRHEGDTGHDCSRGRRGELGME